VKVARSLLSLSIEHPPSTAGTLLARYDFEEDPLPGMSIRVSPFDESLPTIDMPGGLAVSLVKVCARNCIVPLAGARDVALSLTVTAIDAGLYLGISSRRIVVADASVHLLFSIQSHLSRFELAYIAGTPTASGTQILAEGVRPDCVAPVGQPNTLDLRVQGGSIQGSVNGKNVCTVHDAALGAGTFGIYLERTAPEGAARQAIVSSFEARSLPR
jgi:hypothetical protein